MSFLLRILDKIVALFLQHVIKYRLQVICTNLQASFDYSTKNELQSDIKRYYRFLAKILRQVGVNPSPALLERRIQWQIAPELDQWLSEGKSIIATAGHIGNWEWIASYLSLKHPGKVCALYKKIKSNWVNTLMYNRRHQLVKHLIDIKRIDELVRLIQQEPVIILMVADQNPGSDQGIVWVPFLKRLTAFANGPEKLAMRYHLPVVYIHSSTRADGGYDLACQPIYDGNEEVEPGEITCRYVAALENNILENRSHWLWSHKRWKRFKEERTEN